MKVFWSEIQIPAVNLGKEHYFLTESDDEILLFYVNLPSVICGRLQVPFAEVEIPLLKQKNIFLLRRNSGGGSVFHDQGNLNFAFIAPHQPDRNNYFYYNNKIIEALKLLGFRNLQTDGRNIFFNGKKISGTAQYKSGERLLHHGTLLINTDLNFLQKVLRRNYKYKTRCTESCPVPVTNINPDIQHNISEMMQRVVCSISTVSAGTTNISSTSAFVEKSANYISRYSSDNWNYLASPSYTYSNSFYFREIEHHISFEVVKGKIINQKQNIDSVLSGLDTAGCYHTFNSIQWYLKDQKKNIYEHEQAFLLHQLF